MGRFEHELPSIHETGQSTLPNVRSMASVAAVLAAVAPKIISLRMVAPCKVRARRWNSSSMLSPGRGRRVMANSRCATGAEISGADTRVAVRVPAPAGAMVVASVIIGFDVVFSLDVTT